MRFYDDKGEGSNVQLTKLATGRAWASITSVPRFFKCAAIGSLRTLQMFPVSTGLKPTAVNMSHLNAGSGRHPMNLTNPRSIFLLDVVFPHSQANVKKARISGLESPRILIEIPEKKIRQTLKIVYKVYMHFVQPITKRK